MQTNGHWKYAEIINIDDWFGFIYRIVELSTGKEYIGKKQFWSFTKKAVKGKTNKKTVKKESNWKIYTSSSTHINEAIVNNGIENYSFFIESLHKTRGSLFYAEVEKQIKENVLREKLEDGITPKYYNRQIAGVKFIPPMILEEEQYTNIDNYIITPNNMFYGNMIGKYNGMFGKHCIKKDLTYEEYYGEERAAMIKQKLSEANKGKESKHKGLAIHTDEQKEKWSNDPRRIHYGENNGMYGKPCYINMTDKEKEQWKTNVGNSIKGIKRTDETKKKMSESFSGRIYPKVECPHCHKQGSNANMIRYHFEYCKENPNAIPYKIPEKILCEYCDKKFDPGNFKLHHGDKCKKNPNKS